MAKNRYWSVSKVRKKNLFSPKLTDYLIQGVRKENLTWLKIGTGRSQKWERIICCQIFCDLLLKSAFGRIFNVMQLILVKIKWHIKWKYLIQKFHDICLLYYFKAFAEFSVCECHSWLYWSLSVCFTNEINQSLFIKVCVFQI